MKGVGQRYVSYINAIEKRSGTLWQGRYKASLVEEGDYLLACMHYIETTPVREAVVKTAKNYQWSSYLANTQGEDTEVKITQHESYLSLESWMDKNDKQTQEKYKQLLRESLTQQQLQEINKAINSNSIYASSHFKEVLKNRV
jgi:putative transposase